MKPEDIAKVAAIGVGSALLVFAWSMASGPVGTIAAIGLVLLLVAK